MNTNFPVPQYRRYGGIPPCRLKALMMSYLRTRDDNTFTKNKYCVRNVELIKIIIWFSYTYKEILSVGTISIFSRNVPCN